MSLLAAELPCTIEPAAAGAAAEEAPAHHATAHEGKASQPAERAPTGSRCCDAMASCALHLAPPTTEERILPIHVVSVPSIIAGGPRALARAPDIPPPKA